MINNNNIKINISYKLLTADTWYNLSIAPEDYFDEKYLDKNEVIEIDSVPVFTFSIDYLVNVKNIDRDKILTIKEVILDTALNKKIEANETFWFSQRNSIREIRETNSSGEICNNEFILTSLVHEDSESKTWEVFRFFKKNDMLVPVVHTLITEDDKGGAEHVILTELDRTILHKILNV